MDNPSPSYSEQVTAAVNAAIKSSGVTVLSLSETTGIPRTSLIRRLDGHAAFSVDELARIAAALQVDVKTLAAA